MFRLTRLTDYAIALLTHMVSDDKPIWSASDLATRTRLPQPTVSKILKHLAKTGLIRALRGAAGGYQLPRPPQDISILQIVEAMDGPISITDCSGVSRDSECLIRDFCVLGGRWNKINHAVRHALATVSLDDMAAKGPRANHDCGIDGAHASISIPDSGNSNGDMASGEDDSCALLRRVSV